MGESIDRSACPGIDKCAIIDALAVQACILDADASIIATNRAWQAFAAEAGVPAAMRHFEGTNYLEVCESAAGAGDEFALRSARGIRAVLAGSEGEFRLDYPCPKPDGGERWFRMRAAPVAVGSGYGAVVVHSDVTAEHRLARKLAAESRHFRALFDLSPLPLWVFDTQSLKFLAVNTAAVEEYGYSRDEFLGMTIEAIRTENEVLRLHAYLDGRLPEANRAGMWKHRRRDGSEFDVEIISRAIGFDGRPARLVLARDVTERLRDERVREIQNRVLAQISARDDLSAILRSVATGIEEAAPGTIASILLLDADGRMRHGAAPDLPEAFVHAIDGLAIGEQVGSCGTAMHRGKPVYVEDIPSDPLWQDFAKLAEQAGLRACWSVPVFDTRKNVVGSLALYYREARAPQGWERELIELFASLVGVAVERRRQDDALQLSEQRLRKLFREAAAGIAVIGEDGTFVQVNGQLASMLGYDESEIAALNYHDLTHASERDAIRATMRAILAGERQAESLEQRLVTRDGQMRWGRVRFSAQTGRDGRPLHLIAIIEDVTERKHAEQQLERTRSLQRIAGRIGRVGGWAVNLDEDQVFWSPEIFNILDWDTDDPPPLSESLKLYPPEHRVRIEQALESCARDGAPFDLELEIRTQSGRVRQVRAVGEAECEASGRIRRLIGAFQDVTEFKRLEAQREQLGKRLEATLDSMSDAFLLLDHDWNFVYLNREAERLVRSEPGELLGRNLWEAFPEYRDSPAYARYHHAVETGEPQRFEIFFEPLDNWFAVSAFPVPEGLAVYFTVTTETRQLQEQLQRAQRLESVGQLTGGMAHDFNNLLTVILGNAELLRESLGEHQELVPVAGMIEQAAQRGAELTRRLLAFARRQPLEPEAVDVNRLIADLERLLHRTLGEHVEIEVSRGASLWPAMIDRGQFESALINLAINARDAMPGGGKLTIETANVRIDDEYQRSHANVEAGQYVLVAVSDTGTGIAAEDIDKVFEPFFTTKQKGGGTGLGLSMVYGFIKQSRGHIRIYSEPGEGTTIRLYLPRAYSGVDTKPIEKVGAHPGGSEAVLVVEDDPDVRAFAEAVLQRFGYRVSAAAGGHQALELLEQGMDCDLLFTDVVMPGGMGGRELADAATRLRPGLKVLYTSGYTENAIVHQGRLDPGVNLLSKPYRRDQLARRVRQVLESGGAGGRSDDQD